MTSRVLRKSRANLLSVELTTTTRGTLASDLAIGLFPVTAFQCYSTLIEPIKESTGSRIDLEAKVI